MVFLFVIFLIQSCLKLTFSKLNLSSIKHFTDKNVIVFLDIDNKKQKIKIN